MRWWLRRAAVAISGLALATIPFAFLPGVEIYENDCFGRVFTAAHSAPCSLPTEPTRTLVAGGGPLAICVVNIAIFAYAFFRWPRLWLAAISSLFIVVLALLSAGLANHFQIFSFDKEVRLWPANVISLLLVLVIGLAALVALAMPFIAIRRARERRRRAEPGLAPARVIRG